MDVPSGSSAPFVISFTDDDITGLAPQAIKITDTKAYYDLTGRKVNAPQKGNIYIQNGKKVLY